MASHLSLIKEGLKERNWQKVSDGFEQISGERIEVAAAIQVNPDIESRVKAILAKYFYTLGAKFADEVTLGELDQGEIQELSESNTEDIFDDKDVIVTKVTLDSRKQPSFGKIQVNTKLIDDAEVPPDNPAIYTNAIKNPAPPREAKKLIKLNCRECNKVFEKEEGLILVLDGVVNGDICDKCMLMRKSDA